MEEELVGSYKRRERRLEVHDLEENEWESGKGKDLEILVGGV